MKTLANNLMKIALIPFAMMAADTQEPVSNLLAEARMSSSRISADWKSATQQPKLSWTSDSAEAARLKEDVVAASTTRSKLDGLRNQATASQLAALDQIIAVMQEIAGNATTAVDFLSTNQLRLTDKEYKAYLAASSDTSTRLAVLVSQLVEYEGHRDKFEAAKRMLLAAR